MPFDDDDIPSSAAAASNGDDGTQNGEDAMEEGMPDYKLFNSLFNKKSVSSKTIRKGEKDFESHGTMAQDNTLEASRQAMEDVLSYTRIHREDTWVRGWLFPDVCATWPDDDAQKSMNMRDRVVVVDHEKGSWTRDAGRVMPGDRAQAGVGRLWLLPEEALYLVERGTLDLWWPTRSLEDLLPPLGSDAEKKEAPGPDDYESGLPLSLEAAYSMLIGEEGDRGRISLPKYQVYTHLKRAGFSILRAPSTSQEQNAASTTSLWEWFLSLLSPETPIQHEPAGPLVKPGLYRAYAPIYKRLAIIPRHKPSPTPTLAPTDLEPAEPFRVFYHIWRPSPTTPFSKKSPSSPDFRIAVSDTLTSNVPTLDEITRLLDSTPWDPPLEGMKGKLYQKLKHGYRNVLVAVVDCGLVNFIRFGEGAFGEEALTWRFDSAGMAARGGKKGGGGRGRGGRGRGRGRGGRGGGRRS